MSLPEKNEILIAAIGTSNYSTGEGSFEAYIQDSEGRRYLSRYLKKTSPQRAVIQGMTELVSGLKAPSKVRLLSPYPMNFGIKSSNERFKATLIETLTKAGHDFSFEADPFLDQEFGSVPRSSHSGTAQPKTEMKWSEGDLPAATWFPYVFSPIGIGWEHLGTVSECLQSIRIAEGKDRDVADSTPHTSAKFELDLKDAHGVAVRLGMDPNLSDSPSVLWMPGFKRFVYGFLFKDVSRDTGYIISPFEMKWINTGCETDIIPKVNGTGICGTYRQVIWAEEIIRKTTEQYLDLSFKVPLLKEAFDDLIFLLKNRKDASWIIANRKGLKINTKIDNASGEISVIAGSKDRHPLRIYSGEIQSNSLNDLWQLLEPRKRAFA